jgi:hypothetical protein
VKQSRKHFPVSSATHTVARSQFKAKGVLFHLMSMAAAKNNRVLRQYMGFFIVFLQIFFVKLQRVYCFPSSSCHLPMVAPFPITFRGTLYLSPWVQVSGGLSIGYYQSLSSSLLARFTCHT